MDISEIVPTGITHADWLQERELLRSEITDYILAGEEPPPSLWARLYRVAAYVERTAPSFELPAADTPHGPSFNW